MVLLRILTNFAFLHDWLHIGWPFFCSLAIVRTKRDHFHSSALAVWFTTHEGIDRRVGLSLRTLRSAGHCTPEALYSDKGSSADERVPLKKKKQDGLDASSPMLYLALHHGRSSTGRKWRQAPSLKPPRDAITRRWRPLEQKIVVSRRQVVTV